MCHNKVKRKDSEDINNNKVFTNIKTRSIFFTMLIFFGFSIFILLYFMDNNHDYMEKNSFRNLHIFALQLYCILIIFFFIMKPLYNIFLRIHQTYIGRCISFIPILVLLSLSLYNISSCKFIGLVDFLLFLYTILCFLYLLLSVCEKFQDFFYPLGYNPNSNYFTQTESIKKDNEGLGILKFLGVYLTPVVLVCLTLALINNSEKKESLLGYFSFISLFILIGIILCSICLENYYHHKKSLYFLIKQKSIFNMKYEDILLHKVLVPQILYFVFIFIQLFSLSVLLLTFGNKNIDVELNFLSPMVIVESLYKIFSSNILKEIDELLKFTLLTSLINFSLCIYSIKLINKEEDFLNEYIVLMNNN